MRAYRSLAQWRALFAGLRAPGDWFIASVSYARAWQIRRLCAHVVDPRMVRIHRVNEGVRFVRLAEPRNLTRRLANLAVGEEATFSMRFERSVASLATRVRHAHPGRSYRTHRDRRAGTFSVVREA